MSNNSGISISNGNLVAGAVAINGTAINNGSGGDVNIQIVNEAVRELEKAVAGIPIPPATKERISAELKSVEQNAAAPEPEQKQRAADSLKNAIELLKLGGATISQLLSVVGPVKTLAGIIGTSLAALGL